MERAIVSSEISISLITTVKMVGWGFGLPMMEGRAGKASPDAAEVTHAWNMLRPSREPAEEVGQKKRRRTKEKRPRVRLSGSEAERRRATKK